MAVRFNETLYLFGFEILTIVLKELLNNFQIAWNWMQSDYYSTIVLYIHLCVPLVLSDIFNFNSLIWIRIKYLCY